jgi:hypothetical protein
MPELVHWSNGTQDMTGACIFKEMHQMRGGYPCPLQLDEGKSGCPRFSGRRRAHEPGTDGRRKPSLQTSMEPEYEPESQPEWEPGSGPGHEASY